MNNKCISINIVWIERGILLGIILYIIRYYKKFLEKKVIIINIKKYREILKIIFPNLKIKKYKKHNKKNFYFNIRTIIKKKDIIIDYLNNYEDIINSEYIEYIPWFDLNDPLIIYKYSKKKIVSCNEFKLKNKFFLECNRGNYYGLIWDIYIENTILNLYKNKFNMNIQNIINNYFSNYINTYNNECPKINIDNNNININDDESLKKLLNILNSQFSIINNILENKLNI